MVPFLLAILSSPSLSHGVKDASGQTLVCLTQFRPKFLAKSDMVKPMLLSLVQLIAVSNASGAGSLFVMDRTEKSAKENTEDEDVSDDMLNQQLAQTVLDAMAIYIPSKYFTETALSICGTVKSQIIATIPWSQSCLIAVFICYSAWRQVTLRSERLVVQLWVSSLRAAKMPSRRSSPVF